MALGLSIGETSGLPGEAVVVAAALNQDGR